MSFAPSLVPVACLLPGQTARGEEFLTQSLRLFQLRALCGNCLINGALRREPWLSLPSLPVPGLEQTPQKCSCYE